MGQGVVSTAEVLKVRRSVLWAKVGEGGWKGRGKSGKGKGEGGGERVGIEGGRERGESVGRSRKGRGTREEGREWGEEERRGTGGKMKEELKTKGREDFRPDHPVLWHAGMANPQPFFPPAFTVLCPRWFSSLLFSAYVPVALFALLEAAYIYK